MVTDHSATPVNAYSKYSSIGFSISTTPRRSLRPEAGLVEEAAYIEERISTILKHTL